MGAAKPIHATGCDETERRRIDRNYLVRIAAKLIDGDTESLCLLRDISALGMKATICQGPAIGDTVRVELPDGQHADAVLVWLDECSGGFRFEQPIDVRHVLNPPPGDLPRRAPRLATDAIARVTANQYTTMVRLLDISLRGTKIDCDAIGLSGDPVTLELDGMTAMRATIRWCGRGCSGLEFHAPIAFSDLCSWLAAHPPLIGERSPEGPIARRAHAFAPPPEP